MQIIPTGRNFYGGTYQSWENVQIIDAAVSSVTFASVIDGDADYLFAINMKWKNPLTGAKKLMLKWNGTTVPNVVMWRSQRNLSTNTNEDTSQTEYYVAELQAAVANTQFEGVVYFNTNRDGFARFMIVEGMANDATTVLGDAKRASYRQARSGNITTDITSITIAVEDASNAIGIGSEFYLWKAA